MFSYQLDLIDLLNKDSLLNLLLLKAIFKLATEKEWVTILERVTQNTFHFM